MGLLDKLKPKKPALSEEEQAKKDEEEIEKRNALLDRLLPWRLEQKVACFLNPIKIPIIIIVGSLGCYIEYRVGIVEEDAWYASVWRNGPTCYVHQMSGPIVNNTALEGLGEALNSTFYPVTQALNESLKNSNTNCTHTDEGEKCEIFDSGWQGLNFPVDHCGITDQCELEKTEGGEDILNHIGKGSGIEARLPFVPFALIWAIYKLIFLPIHPVDRLNNLVLGFPSPMPEPVFKLLTEPNFRTCEKPMSIIVMIGKIIRYSMLPNSLLVPLLTMGSHPKCPNFIHYNMDTQLGRVIYFWVVSDLIIVGSLFAAGKTVCGGKLIGKCSYRCYKTWWFMSLILALIFFIVDFFLLFNLNFLAGLMVMLKLVITIDLSFNFAIDFVQALATVNIILDVLQLTIMILSLILPPLMNKIPACRRFVPKEEEIDGVDAREYEQIESGK